MNSILRAIAMLVSTSVITILAGILRQKMIALELGPAGIGSLGLLVSLSAAMATLGGLGLSTSGVQRISVTENSDVAAAAQQSILWGSAGLGFVSGILALIISPLLGLPSTGPERWLIALTVVFLIASAGQVALLNGLGKIRQIAWMNGLSAVISTTLTIIILLLIPSWGLYTALLSPALLLFGLGLWFRQGEGASATTISRLALWKQLRTMLGLGIVFAAGTGIASLGQYAARLYLQSRYGEAELGQYQAAWSITMIYLSVLLSAMSVEFFPRVTKVVAEENPEKLNKVINDQVRLILVLSVPVICLVVLLSKVVITLLYSAQFELASGLARQQFLGDIFKLAAWSLSYTLLAQNAKLFIFLSELVWAVVYLVLLVIFDRIFGLSEIGWAYVCAYAVYLPFLAFLYWKNTQKGLSYENWLCISGAALIVMIHIIGEPVLWARSILILIDLTALLLVAIRYLNNKRVFNKQ